MKSKKIFTRSAGRKMQFLRALALFVCGAMFASTSLAQTTAGGTQIQNQASATYSDGGGNNYSTVSNTVIITVANVSGLTITPDAGNRAAVVAGQQGALYSFRVTNTGNFADQVRFLANGASVQANGAGTIASAVIDVDGSGTITAADTNILTNSADVVSASIAQNGFIDVLVSVNINANAASGSVVNVQLGDATTGSPTFDNQAANSSAHEVRTVSTVSVNGLREARGDMSATVDSDAQLVLSLTAPAGPLALGSNIGYSWGLCNTGLRGAQSITLSNAPAGSNAGVFIIAPIPVGTALASGQTFPAGTLYSTSALTVSPLTAIYTTTAPADLSTVRRAAFNTGASLAAGACATAVPVAVTITTTDATLDIFEIGDAFANNSVSGALTDQSGDAIAGKGDGNADFNEPVQGGTASATQGFQQKTTLTRAGSVLIGPLDSAAAVGPTSNNDDYTNRSVTTGIAGIAFGGATTAVGTIVYSNTLRNAGNTSDTFVVNVPGAPAGFTVEISLDGGTTYTTMTGGNSVSVAVNFNSEKTILVRVTAPAGTAILAESGFAVTIRAASTLTSSAYNETIDRLYTGFLRMDKTAVVTNGTGVGGANDAVSGAVIEYTIAYRNLAATGGTGNSTLSVSNLVITENGSLAPNNWAATTDQVIGSAADTRGGTITGDAASSTALTDTVPTLAPQQSGTFKFRRVIR